MQDMKDLVFVEDLARLPKDTLKNAATEANIPEDDEINLAVSIFNKLKQGADMTAAETIIRPFLFAGKTSVSWYPLIKSNKRVSLSDVITEKTGFDPLVKIKIPMVQELSTKPMIIGGTALNNDKTLFLLRLAFKTGIKKSVGYFSSGIVEQSTIVTVVIDENSGFLEIRGDAKNAKRVASFLGDLLQGAIEPLQRQTVTAAFASQIEQFADSLGGKLLETISTPDEILETLTAEQSQAIVNILIAIDDYFVSGEFQALEAILRECRVNFPSEEYLAIPFTAIVLTGMNELQMKVKDADLREQPLFSILQPYLQHRGGFIRFPVVENGIINSYTIKVGLVTNTVYFLTPATEQAIQAVRNKVLNLE